MLKNSFYLLLFIVCFGLTSCTPDKLSEKALYTYLKDESNGLMHRWKKDPFEISVMYKPSSLLAKQELGEETDLSKIQEVNDRYNQYLYFVLSYSYKGGELLNAFGGDKEVFASLINQLSFGMNENVNIITDQKYKVPLSDYIHNRNYGKGSESSVLLVFNKNLVQNQSTEYFKLKLKDIGIRIGNKSFVILKEKLEKCPTLK